MFERRIELLEAAFGVNRLDKFDNVVLVHAEILGKVRMAVGVWSAFAHIRDDPTQDECFVERSGLTAEQRHSGLPFQAIRRGERLVLSVLLVGAVGAYLRELGEMFVCGCLAIVGRL